MNARRPLIIVGCDGSTDSAHAVSWAAAYARATEGSVRLVAAWDWPTFEGAPIVYGGFNPARLCRERVRDEVTRTGFAPERIDWHVAKGNAAQTLINEAADADLLVVGSHGLGAFSRLVLGSVSASCAQHATAPVAIVRLDAEQRKRRGVVVGIDDSDNARNALRWAMDYADLVGEPLKVVYCSDPPPMPPPMGYPRDVTYDAETVQVAAREWLEDTIAKEAAERGRPVRLGAEPVVIAGRPAEVLVDFSQSATVLVVGRRGMGGFRRLVSGSVSTALAHHATSTVVVVPTR